MDLDEQSRVRLSAQTTTAPDLLRELAADPSVTVRATLALNPAVPHETNVALARDPDERVRALLAGKLGSIAPTLSDDVRQRLRNETYETLTALAEDEAVRVRAAIAEAVKDLPDAPRAIILRLAQDESVMVCEPVIRFSPLLTTDDLVALVATAPSTGTRLAVARRPSIDQDVSDALVSRGTDDVVLALLLNGSAQIREATLDALVTRSCDHHEWHEPLVRRPTLSPRAVKTLSDIVANHLMEVLAARSDVDPLLATEIRVRVTAHLGGELMAGEAPPVADIAEPHAMMDIATRLEPGQPEPARGKPPETDLLDAARDGDAGRAAVLLADAADVPLSAVRRAATLRSAKGLVSLTWKAGFSMKTGYALQVLLARLSPGAALKPGPGGSFPLSVQEMRWQIDFLAEVKQSGDRMS